jgi:hypothetical protein
MTENFPMNRSLIALAMATSLLLAGTAYPQEENSLTRDEVSQVKKKLVASLDALGKLPAPYSMEKESFDLPTNAYPVREGSKRYSLVSAGANRTYGTQKKAQDEAGDMSKDYQTKILEAQAKGDYETMAKLSQEMSKKMNQVQLNAVQAHKEPIEVSIRFNVNPEATIDPDAVLFERSGAIALKVPDQNSRNKERLSIYVDPVALKSTKQLSRVSLRQPEEGVAKRNAVLSITIEFSGPAADVDAWAKKVDIGKVLSQIDGGN